MAQDGKIALMAGLAIAAALGQQCAARKRSAGSVTRDTIPPAQSAVRLMRLLPDPPLPDAVRNASTMERLDYYYLAMP
jgi:hypothetical protein